jgi:hypothetical protein
MSFDINSIKKTKADTPARILLYGPHKIGKSTFAANADNPIFIPTEDGLEAIEAQAFPLCRQWSDVIDAVTTLYTEKHDFKTCVLDSADWAETLAQQEVVRNYKEKKVDGIESIGYGKGYVYAAETFRNLLDGLNSLRTHRNMEIIILCHAEIKRFDDPLAESYDRYQIKLHKIIGKMVQEWADIIGFSQNESTTKTKEGEGFDKDRTRAIDLNRRVIKLSPNAAYDAGNRYGLPETLPLDYAVFKDALNKARGEK